MRFSGAGSALWNFGRLSVSAGECDGSRRRQRRAKAGCALCHRSAGRLRGRSTAERLSHPGLRILADGLALRGGESGAGFVGGASESPTFRKRFKKGSPGIRLQMKNSQKRARFKAKSVKTHLRAKARSLWRVFGTTEVVPIQSLACASRSRKSRFVFVEDDRCEAEDVCILILPAVGVHASFAAGLLEKSLPVPLLLDWNLRQQ